MSTERVELLCLGCGKRRRHAGRVWFGKMKEGWPLRWVERDDPTYPVWALLQTFDQTLSDDRVVVYHVTHPGCGHGKDWREDKVAEMLRGHPSSISL